MKFLLIICVRFYQLALRSFFPPACKFSPSCSHYCIEALEKHGAIKGLFLSGKRILRCNPFTQGGVDEVP